MIDVTATPDEEYNIQEGYYKIKGRAAECRSQAKPIGVTDREAREKTLRIIKYVTTGHIGTPK